jgi:hypothetical protein
VCLYFGAIIIFLTISIGGGDAPTLKSVRASRICNYFALLYVFSRMPSE